MPSMPGIRMSIRTTSGRCSRAAATASAPSDACATTSMPGSEPRISAKPVRTSSWSSATTTRITCVRARPGSSRVHPEAAAGRGAGGELRRRRPRPARASRPGPARSRAGAGRVAPVRRRRRVTRTPSSGPVTRHGDPRGARVLEAVGQRLLHDAVGRQVDPDAARRPGRRRPPASPAARRLDASARRAPAGRPGSASGRGGGRRSGRRSSRSAAESCRISASDRRPVAPISCDRRPGASPGRCRGAARPRPAWTTITLIAWPMMSCSSRVIRSPLVRRAAGGPLLGRDHLGLEPLASLPDPVAEDARHR